MITKLQPEGKNFIGEAKIMDTPYGKIVKGLIDEGSIRSIFKRYGFFWFKKTANYVGKDFYLSTTAADIVADPKGSRRFR